MAFKVNITPSNIQFTTESSDNILDAALDAKINLPHGCKDGACSSCKALVVSGEIRLDPYSTSALSNAELANNYVLLCKAHALSDVVIDLPGFSNGLPIKTLPAKIESIEKVGSVAILKLKLPANQNFEYYAGQYIDIIHGGKNRSYSMASSPTTPGIVELHIRYRPGGVFSDAVWHDLREQQILRFRGPLGSFTLQASQQPILLVCTGTGFAPIKSILEYMIASNNQRQIDLVWGNYVPEDFYLLELIHNWQQKLNLKVTLCSNENTPSGYFPGLVTEYIGANFPDLSQHEVYACGNIAMIENLYNQAHNRLGMLKTNFFSDAFTPSV